MAFLQSIILGSTSFLLGLVFVCQIIDIPLLYHTHLTESSLESAYAFYTMWYDAPKAVKALLHTALGIPLFAIVCKLHMWSESAVFFDGSCLVLHMASIIIYLTIHVPNLPVFGEYSLRDPSTRPSSSTLCLLPIHVVIRCENTVKSANVPYDANARVWNEEEKQEAVRVLSAGNALVGFVSHSSSRPSSLPRDHHAHTPPFKSFSYSS